MRLIDADELMERLQSRFYAHNLKCDFDRCARSVILSCMEAVQRSPTICEPTNDPLTLEELREMDGEPVFIKRIGSDHPDDRSWALVDVGHELCKTVDGVKAFFEFYGKSWLAYRRKPEEGTT